MPKKLEMMGMIAILAKDGLALRWMVLHGANHGVSHSNDPVAVPWAAPH
jgi:hypothetical protein